MEESLLPLLRRELGPQVAALTVAPIKESASPAAVYRVALVYEGEAAGPHSVIVKRIAPGWPEGEAGQWREVRFYQTLSPRLGLDRPRLYYAGPEPGSENLLVVMEDVGATHHFPAPTHVWSADEMGAIMDAYARFHLKGQEALPPAACRTWLFERYERRVQNRAGELVALAGGVTERGYWPALPKLPRLVVGTLAEIEQYGEEPATVLHNDVYPPNLALPCDDTGDMILVDWEMVGWGMAEMDLAYMFCQPYGSHRAVDRDEALAQYWAARARWGGKAPPAEARRARQQYADRLLALWLIPVAHRSAVAPYPEGSPPRAYWDAMFEVLGARLQQLCDEA
jgi:hypothetical protein